MRELPGQDSRDELALLIMRDRATSRGEIMRDYYPHANRSLRDYCTHIPRLPSVLQRLAARGTPIDGLDIGCGTGRAAQELSNTYPTISMSGITLCYHPPIKGTLSLPRDRIHICHAGKTPFKPESFDLISAVGSLDTSDTTAYQVQALFDLLKPDGYLLVATIVPFTDESNGALYNAAHNHGHAMHYGRNALGLDYYVFAKKE